MKLAISASGRDLDSQINPRFGRCDYLLILDTETKDVEFFVNENKNLGGGAGIQTAGFMVSKGVTGVITGSCGPNAMDVFKSANVDVFTGQTGSVRQAVDRFVRGELAASDQANAAEKSGMKAGVSGDMGSRGGQSSGCRAMGGQGMGRGRGGGRGMGGGMGGGMGRRG